MALDQTFDADTLADLRKGVLAAAAAAGMADPRAAEVMLAVHELAANAVRHGGGAGRARLRVVGGELRCQVSDAGPGSPDGDAHGAGAGQAPSWPVRRGHGLWPVRNAADHVSTASGLGGSEVTLVFALSRAADRGPVPADVHGLLGAARPPVGEPGSARRRGTWHSPNRPLRSGDCWS